MRKLIPLFALVVMVIFAMRQRHEPRPVTSLAAPVSAGELPPVASTPVARAGYHCDGRTRCSQMSSCEEATFFLRNCPGVKMDGDHDGVPCEQQFCSN